MTKSLILALPLILVLVQWQTCHAIAGGNRPTPPAIRSAAKDILARPEFRTQTDDSWRKSAEKWVMRTLSNALRWLGQNLHLDRGGSILVARALVISIVLALAVLVFLLLLRFRNRRHQEGSKPKAPGPVVRTQLDQTDLAKQALLRASEGDFPAAFRLTYLAVLLLLDRSGAIRYHRSKTNWEYVSVLRSKGKMDLSKDMESLSRTFDLTQYGSQPCRAEDYDACAAFYSRVSSEEGRPA